MNGRRRLAAAAVAASVALALGLSGCTNDALADQYLAGDNKGFIGGNGLTAGSIPVEDRGAPISFTGSTGTETITSADVAGDVVAVNFWYATCGPCRAEAPALEAAAQAFEGDDVAFVGVNLYDSAESAASFAETYAISYPSLLAISDPELKLAFADATTLGAVPTTLVLDRQGRVAARIVGALEDDSILTTLIRETLAEDS